MTNELSRTVRVVNELGLHARAAAKVADVARRARFRVLLVRDDEAADASSVIDILTLACSKGTLVTIRIEDSSDRNILETLASLFDSGFDED